MKRLILFILFSFFVSTAFAAEGRIYARLVTAGGATDGNAFEISSGTTGHTQSQPRVAFYDDRFLVVWQEWNGANLDIKAARIAMDGTVLDTTPLVIASTSRTDAVPDVDADSTGWVVVWHSFPSTNVFPSLYARRINYDGTMGSTTSGFGDENGYGSLPRIAWSSDQSKFCIVYTTYAQGSSPDRAIRNVLLTSALSPSIPDTYWTQADLGTQQYYDVAAMPELGWTYTRHGEAASTYGTYAGHAAVSFNANGTKNSGNYLNVGKRGAELAGSTAQLDNTSDRSTPPKEHAWGRSAVARDSSYIIAVWERWHRGGQKNNDLSDSDLYMSRVNEYTRVDVLGGVAASTASGVSESHPALAGDEAGNLLLVYNKTTDGSTEIASRIITESSGLTASITEVILRTDTTGSRRSQVDVAYGNDGGDPATKKFLAVWTEGWWGKR